MLSYIHLHAQPLVLSPPSGEMRVYPAKVNFSVFYKLFRAIFNKVWIQPWITLLKLNI